MNGTCTHALTPIEKACWVTLEDAARITPRGAFFDRCTLL